MMILTTKIYSRLAGILGAFAFLIAIATIPICDEIGLWFWFWLVAALGGFGLFLRFHFKALKEAAGSRQALLTLNLFLLLIGFVGCLVMLNLILDKRSARLDLTKASLFSLKEASKKFATTFSDEMTVTCFIPDDLPVGHVSLFSYAEEKLKLLSDLNPRIHYRMIVPTAKPEETARYGLAERLKNDPGEAVLVIEPGLKKRSDPPSDQRVTLFRQDFISDRFDTQRHETIPTLMFESAIMQAAKRLGGEKTLAVTQRLPRGGESLTLVNGRMRPLDSLCASIIADQTKDEFGLNRARQILASANISVTATPTLNIEWQHHPDVILLAGLETPLSRSEVERLQALIREGANLVVLQGFNLKKNLQNPEVLTSINEVMEPFKVQIRPQQLMDPTQAAGSPSFPLMLLMPEHPITRWIGRAFFPYVAPLQLDQGLDPHGRLTQEPLLSTTQNPILEQLEPIPGENKWVVVETRPEKNLVYGAAIERDNNFDQSTRLVAVTSHDFFRTLEWNANNIPYQTPQGNYQFLVSVLEWAGHRVRDFPAEVDDAIQDRVTLAETEQRILIFIFVLLYPLIFLSLGIWIWARRSKM